VGGGNSEESERWLVREERLARRMRGGKQDVGR